MTAVIFYIDFNEEKDSLIGLEQKLLEKTSSGLAQAMWEYNQKSIESQVDSLHSLDDIIHIKITDENGSEIYSVYKDGDQSADKNLKIRLESLDGSNQLIGWMYAGITYENMHERLNRRVLFFFISQLLKLLALSALILFIIHKVLTRHIEKIAKAISSVDYKEMTDYEMLNLNRRSSRNDELDVLVDKINDLGVQISNSNKKNKDDKNKLKQEKDLATAKVLQSAKLASIGQVAAGVAHEINNPLAIINGYNSVVLAALKNEDFSKPERLVKSLDKISVMIKRIKKIIDGMLTFSREGGTVEEFVEISVKDLLNEVSILYEQRVKMEDIDLEAPEAPPEDLTVKCRNVPISQVIYNLISNSVDAVSKNEEKWIKFEIKDLGDKVEFSVTDSGNGIPAHVAEKLFQPFFTTKSVGAGTGLGLSICQGILKEHGSELVVDMDCENTRFYFQLNKS
jgi:C4-dicarboxylate-specific signal transduction histidine kinase